MNSVQRILICVLGILPSIFFSCEQQTERTSSVATDFELDTIVHNQLFTIGNDVAEQKLEVAIRYIYPITDTLLSSALARCFFPENLVASSSSQLPDSLITEYSKALFSDFEADALQEVDDSKFAMGLNWQQEVSNDIAYYDRYLASVVIRHYTFTGGAHGFESQLLMSVDRSSGRVVQEGDLFIDDYEDELNQIIVERLMSKYNISKIEELGEYGFFEVSEIKSNKNFYLTNTEIVYVFNTYEIAPYSTGAIEIRIPYDFVGKLIRNGSILEHYV